MSPLRRKLATLLIAALVAPAAQAAFPDKPIRIVVGFPGGSTADQIARALAPRLSEQLGQTVIVDNKAGAGSSLAAQDVARAAPDGATLLLSTTANVINAAVSPQSKPDFARELAPVMLLAENPVLLIAPGNGKFSTLAEVTAAAKAAPDKITYGSSGIGTFTHLYGELFAQSAGVRLTHVPYKGSTQAMTDVMSGQVDLSFTPSTPVLGPVKAGKLKALAVIGRQRMAALPGTPTFDEAGLRGFDSALWFGVHAPSGTPAAVIERLASELQRALAAPDVKAALAAQSIDVVAAGPAPFADLIGRELSQWARLAKAAGVENK